MTTTTHLVRSSAILGLVLVATGCAAEQAQQESSSADTAEGIAAPLIDRCGEAPNDSVVRGALAFAERHPSVLDGKGRACSDCHLPADSFQLSPEGVEARYQKLQARRARHPHADDPLFRPIDADDFRTRGDAADDFSNLRQNGLVRVTFPLPSNFKLIDPATGDRKSTRLNSSHSQISYAVFCLKKKIRGAPLLSEPSTGCMLTAVILRTLC